MQFKYPKYIKVVTSLMIIFLILILATCNNNTDSNSAGLITKTKLTNKKQKIAYGISNGANTYIFDINLKKTKAVEDIKFVEYWVDHYEKGNFKEKVLNLEMSLDSGDKLPLNSLLIFATEAVKENKNEEKWTFCQNNGGVSVLNSKIIKIDPKITGYTYRINEKTEIITDKACNLAFFKGGENSESLYTNYDEETLNKDIARTEHFYILRCKFSKSSK